MRVFTTTYRTIFNGAACVALAAVLTACARHDVSTTGSVKSDFKRTHPITIGEDKVEMAFIVPTSGIGVPFADRRRIENFSRDFVNSRVQSIEIRKPANSINALAVDNAMPEILQAMKGKGVQKHQILVSDYHLEDGEASGLVYISYLGLKASVERCGQWREDMTISVSNKNYGNFGCASQANLAAQVADPRDLVSPRAREAGNAQQSSAIIEKYTAGSNQ